jgi:uncharacterized protein (DUF58 family)
MNKRSFLLVSILCGLILSALISADGEVLLLAIPFLVYLIVAVYQLPSGIALVADRTIDKPGVAAHEEVETRIIVKNQGGNLLNLKLTDEQFSSMTILDGRSSQTTAIRSGEVTEVRYTFEAARGVYSWSRIRACASDPFGLFDIEVNIPAPGKILVRPAATPIRPTTLKSRATLQTAGSISARQAGSGTDFWGVREYRSGDPLRRVNWRLTARHPRKLFTNEYEREEIADFGLILDARRLTAADEVEETLFEHSVRASASLAENLLRNGNRVSLLVFGQTTLTAFPGSGKQHLNKILRNLARAKLGGNMPFANIEHFPTRLFPARSLLVIFSSVDARDRETYARLRAFGYDVLLISPDSLDLSAKTLPENEINALACRATRVERVLQLEQLVRLGVNVIDWQVSQTFESIIRKSAIYFSHRRNI